MKIVATHALRAVAAVALFATPVFAADAQFGAHPAGGGAIQQPAGGSPQYTVDDGVNENNIGLNNTGTGTATQFMWFNRFDIDPLDLGPLQIDQVQIFWDPNVTNPPVVGNAISIEIYSDADTNPANGASHVVTQNDQLAQIGAMFDTYALVPAPQIAAGVNLLVGVVDRWITTGVSGSTFPAAIDQTAPNNGRSWVAAYLSGTPPSPPTIPSDSLFGTIDSFGLPGDWLIRASGTVLPVELMNFSID